MLNTGEDPVDVLVTSHEGCIGALVRMLVGSRRAHGALREHVGDGRGGWARARSCGALVRCGPASKVIQILKSHSPDPHSLLAARVPPAEGSPLLPAGFGTRRALFDG